MYTQLGTYECDSNDSFRISYFWIPLGFVGISLVGWSPLAAAAVCAASGTTDRLRVREASPKVNSNLSSDLAVNMAIKTLKRHKPNA